jgi:hypothetical protein
MGLGARSGGNVAMTSPLATKNATALTLSTPLTDRLVPRRRASLRREVPRAMAPQYEVQTPSRWHHPPSTRSA